MLFCSPIEPYAYLQLNQHHIRNDKLVELSFLLYVSFLKVQTKFLSSFFVYLVQVLWLVSVNYLRNAFETETSC